MMAAAAAAEGRSSSSSASTPPPSNFHTGMQSPARVVGGSCVSAFFHLFEWNPSRRFSLASRRHHLPPGTLTIFPHLVIGLCVHCVAHLFRTRQRSSICFLHSCTPGNRLPRCCSWRQFLQEESEAAGRSPGNCTRIISFFSVPAGNNSFPFF